MMNSVLQRPMFRPQIVRRQAGTPNTGEMAFDPRKYNILNELGVISNTATKDYQISTEDAMNRPQLLDTVFEMITSSTGFDLNSYLNMGESQRDDYIKMIQGRLIGDQYAPIEGQAREDALKRYQEYMEGMAEGGEIKSDAVGIADGLDQETMPSDPNTTGVAKVSPEQYVELMNQVRGDDVPLEGRVQELAMTVGEKDAQDTPLSVLALVQPVFELQEQQGGIAAAPGAQQMMQQAPMQMKEGGIVYRANGTTEEGEDAFTALGSIYDPANIAAIKRFGQEYFGLDRQFDLEATRERYKQMLFDKEKMRDQAYLSAAPYFLQLGATALDPTKSLSDVFTVGASGLAQFGTQVGKETKALEDAALKMALQDKAKEESKESAFIGAIAPELVKNALKDPQTAALTALEITSKTLDNLEKEIKVGVLPSQLQVELDTNIASLEKIKTENKYLPQSLQLDIETKLEQLYGIKYDNDRKVLDNQYQTVLNSFVEDKENAALQGQLLSNINTRLNNAKQVIENEYLPLEKDLGLTKLSADIDNTLAAAAGQNITNDMNQIKLENLNDELLLNMTKTKMEIEKLKYEVENPKKDWEQIKVEDSFRKEFSNNKVKKDTDARYDAYRKMKVAVEASNKEGAGGQGDVALIFEFMKMLDPTSTVREGEFATAKNTGGVPESIANTYNQLLSGGFLQPEQKKQFLDLAGEIFKSQLEQFNTEYNTYAAIAERNFGADKVKNVLPMPSYNVDDLEDLLGSQTISDWLDSYESNLQVN